MTLQRTDVPADDDTGAATPVVTDHRFYNAKGQLIQSGVDEPVITPPRGRDGDFDPYWDDVPRRAAVKSGQLHTSVQQYDEFGRQKAQAEYSGRGVLESTVFYDVNGGYDAVGNMQGYRVVDAASNSTVTHEMRYRPGQGYQLMSIRSTANGQTGEMTQTYDANDQLVSSLDTQRSWQSRNYVNDWQGKMLSSNIGGTAGQQQLYCPSRTCAGQAADPR